MPVIYNRRTSALLVNFFPGESLAGRNLASAGLAWVDARNVNFNGANLVDADFYHTNLSGATFVGANISGALFHASPNGDFTGAIRGDADPPITGWKLDNGVLRRRLDNECHRCNGTELNQCGNCSDHCDHGFCDLCSSCADDMCGHCDYCTGCCDCSMCDCGALTGCPSGNCSACRSCCECDANSSRDYDDGEAREGEPFVYALNSKFKCSRMVGVEWEFNNMINLNDWKSKWRGGIHSDGSCGWEAVTPPIAGDAIAGCLKDLGARFEAEDVSIDNRCGIHVHVDAKDLKWADMYRLLWVYGKIEPLLYLLAGQERAKIDYCKPVGKDYLKSLSEVDRKGAVLAIAVGSEAGGNIKRYMRGRHLYKKSSGRYRGLNIIPWIVGRAYPQKVETIDRKTGKKSTSFLPKPDTTVEFRMHKNSKNSERVIGWAQLCARLVEWCAKATDKEAQDLPKSALRALCQVIAPDLAPWILKRVKEWRKATETKVVNTPNTTARKRTVQRRIKLTETGYQLKAGRL